MDKENPRELDRCFICTRVTDKWNGEDIEYWKHESVLDNYPEFQYSEYKCGKPIMTKYEYCPKCGCKVQGGAT